ncbi:hypothetical protein [Albidovulum sp.]|uniref:hypothetical protein n=1 Tax=Albidovulum sp. TaxID=1872424 RepID=UPI0039B86D13
MGQINRETLLRVSAIAALLFAFALGVVGSMLSLFYAGYFAQYLSLPVVPTLVVLVVLHWLPLALLITTFTKGRPVPRWWSVLYVLASLLPLYVGWDGLVARRDFGDTLLWLPYLLTGLVMAIVGLAIALGRLGGDPM